MNPKLPKNFYESIFDNMLDGLAYCQMIFDGQENPLDFEYIKVNKSFEKLTGLIGAEGKKVTELIPGIRASNPELFEIYGRVSITGKPERFETYVAGLSRWFLVSVYCPKNKFFVAIFQDTTASKQISKNLEDARTAARNVLEDLQVEKETLAYTNSKDDALLESIADGVIATDEGGIITLMNRAAQKMLGQEFAEAEGKSVFDAIPLVEEQGNLIPREKRPLYLALAGTTTTTTSSATESPYYYLCRGGANFPAAVKASPILLDKEIIGAVVVFRDITHEMEIDRAKSEFVSLASHQLRTPLGITKWYLEVLQKEEYLKKAPKTVLDYFNQLQKNNDRVLALVRELLSVSRIDQGRVKDDPKHVDVGKLTQDIVEEMQPVAKSKKVEVHFGIGHQKLPMLTIDPLRLHEVIENLISNAIEYTPALGTVDVSMVKNNETLLISVKDTGIGISVAELGKIYTKFFRAQRAVAQNPEGSGLGLYVVKSYVESWGGKVTVESVEGKGSTFTITLPIKVKDG
jgi:PAS domain S-box-containing protein